MDPNGALGLEAGKSSFANGERVKALLERQPLKLRPAGSDRADVPQVAILFDGQHQVSDAAVTVGHIADDDESIGLDALDLEPVAPLARSIWQIDALGDDPLEAMGAGGRKERLAVGVHLFAQENCAGTFANEVLKGLSAFAQRQGAQIAAVEEQEIEHARDNIPPALGEAGLRRSKIGPALDVEDDRLAVNEGVAAGKLGGVVGDRREFLAPVEALARSNLRLAGVDDDRNAIAVPLDLVSPVWTGRWLIDERRDAGLNP